MKKFIDKLQKSDDSTKRRWLIFLSIISMAVVFFLWIVYLNLTVLRVAPLETTVETERKTGFFAIMKAGFKSTVLEIKNRTINIFNYFKNKTMTEREIIIEKSEQNFILEGDISE